MKSIYLFLTCAICAAVLLGAVLLAVGDESRAGDAKEVAGPTPVMETKELMKIMMDPLWEDLRDQVEKEPTNRRDWRFLYITAFSLAETQNLLFSRNDHDYMATEEWRDLSAQALTATTQLAASVRDQDFKAILKNKDRAMVTCNKCHERFEPTEAPTIEP